MSRSTVSKDLTTKDMEITLTSVAKNIFVSTVVEYQASTEETPYWHCISNRGPKSRATPEKEADEPRPPADRQPAKHKGDAAQEGCCHLQIWESSRYAHRRVPGAIYQQLRFGEEQGQVQQTKREKELKPHSKPSHQVPQQWTSWPWQHHGAPLPQGLGDPKRPVEWSPKKSRKACGETTGCPSRRKYGIHALRKWVDKSRLHQYPRPFVRVLGLQNQMRSRSDKVRPKPLVRMRGEVFPNPIGPSLQPGSFPTVNDFP